MDFPGVMRVVTQYLRKLLQTIYRAILQPTAFYDQTPLTWAGMSVLSLWMILLILFRIPPRASTSTILGTLFVCAVLSMPLGIVSMLVATNVKVGAASIFSTVIIFLTSLLLIFLGSLTPGETLITKISMVMVFSIPFATSAIICQQAKSRGRKSIRGQLTTSFYLVVGSLIIWGLLSYLSNLIGFDFVGSSENSSPAWYVVLIWLLGFTGNALYPMEAMISLCQFQIAQAVPSTHRCQKLVSLIGKSPVYLDELVTLPLPFLSRFLTLISDCDLEEGLERVSWIANNSFQRLSALNAVSMIARQNPHLLLRIVYHFLQKGDQEIVSDLAQARRVTLVWLERWGLPLRNPFYVITPQLTSIAGIYSRLLAASGEENSNVSELLEELLPAMGNVQELQHGREVYLSLTLAEQFLHYQSASELTKARTEVMELLAIPLEESLRPGVLSFFCHLDAITQKAQGYVQVSNYTDKVILLNEAVEVTEAAYKFAKTNLKEPERMIFSAVMTQWREVISSALKDLSGRAEIRAELRTKRIMRDEKVSVILNISNHGRGVAQNVAVEIKPSPNFAVVGESTIALDVIATGEGKELDFSIRPTEKGTFRVAFEISYDDAERRGKFYPFADVIGLIDTGREFTRIPNPYVAGNPIISPKLFFGREDVFDFVLKNLLGAEQKNTLVLHGQRRTGKSSVLLQLRDRVLPQEFIPVYIDMGALPDIKTMDAFLARLAYEISRAARKRGLELEVPTDFSQQPATTFDRFMDAAEDTLGGQRFVVMFDEFELIESKIAEGMDAGVLTYFRNLMQFRDSLVFVFTGTHRLQEMIHSYWSILFGIALNQEISFLEEEATRRLISEPVQDHLEYDDLTIEKIIRVTRCQPYLVQLICWQLVNHLNGQQHNYATINDLNRVLDQTLVTAEAYFSSIWEQSTSYQRLALSLLTTLVYPGKETAALSEIEKGLADKGVAITGHELIAALSELCRRDVLEERTNGELRYRFQIDLVRMWVEKNKPLSRVLIEEGL